MKLIKFYRTVYRPKRRHVPATVSMFEGVIRQLSRFLDRPAKLKDLNDVTIASFVDWRCDQVGSKYTIHKEVGQIKAMWHFAASKNNPATGERWVSETPEIPRIQKPELDPTAYTADELNSLLDACGRFTRYTYCGVQSGLWWSALHAVLLDTGERINAVLQVKFSDLDGDVIKFRPETRKGGCKLNIKRLSQPTMNLINQVRTISRDKIFPWDYSPGVIYQHYKIIRDDAGVYVAGQAFHKLRKTLATFVAVGGGNAQQALGHSSSATTERHYLDKRQTLELDYHKYLPLKLVG